MSRQAPAPTGDPIGGPRSVRSRHPIVRRFGDVGLGLCENVFDTVTPTSTTSSSSPLQSSYASNTPVTLLKRFKWISGNGKVNKNGACQKSQIDTIASNLDYGRILTKDMKKNTKFDCLVTLLFFFIFSLFPL